MSAAKNDPKRPITSCSNAQLAPAAKKQKIFANPIESNETSLATEIGADGQANKKIKLS